MNYICMHGSFGRENGVVHSLSWEICGTEVEDGNLAPDPGCEVVVPTAASAGSLRMSGMLCSLPPAALLAQQGEAASAAGSWRRVASLRAENCDWGSTSGVLMEREAF